MSSPLAKNIIALGLTAFLLLTAVSGGAICICNDSTPKCCENEPIEAQEPGCCQSKLGGVENDLTEYGCSMSPSSSNSVVSHKSCCHLEGPASIIAATLPMVRINEDPDFIPLNIGAVLPVPGFGITVTFDSIDSTSPQSPFHQAPVYLLNASLII
ncbi:MAG: hypothetical protein DRI46_12395 [Chloroflexi bacterium]|nr:MAG: hypothetical protein DRI46_12395 [Chloroflexota bacterium]